MASAQYSLVASLLQNNQIDAARAAALSISCDYVRAAALVLIERTRPILLQRN
jgi:hypothetical protein